MALMHWNLLRKCSWTSIVAGGARAVATLPAVLVAAGISGTAFAAEPVQSQGPAADETASAVRFSRDVLPVLSDRCFHCHGPDEAHREAGLRLDQRESAVADRDGHAAIVPGKPDDSELLKRITSDDPDLVMPPVDSHRQRLAPREVKSIREWIADGAVWGRHWSFEKPVRPALPRTDPSSESAAAVHPIDAFIEQRLHEEGLTLSPTARPHTRLRRVSFDLTGLPPDRADVEAFVADPSEQAWAAQVDRLLQSPHYGERMAMWWLDAARYSDTDGYQGDATRTNWPWRDWVVQSFNSNMRFDRFTIEQFAGDLLPDATPEQILATCFHRNHMTNGEGGRDPEESRIDYVIDRINTTGTVWLGLTLGCCQCHSHKFDPLSQRDYYSLFAFFNSIDEDGRAGSGAKPYLKYQSSLVDGFVQQTQQLVERRQATESTVRKEAEEEFTAWLAAQIERVRGGFRAWDVLQTTSLQAVEGTTLTLEDDGVIQAGGANPRQDDYVISGRTTRDRVTGLRLEVLPHASHTDGKLSRGATGEFVLTDVKLQLRRAGVSQVRDIDLRSAVADAEKGAQGREYGNIKDTLDDDPRNGWTTESQDPLRPHVAVFELAEPLMPGSDEELVFVMLHRSTVGDANIGRFRLSVTDQPGPAVRSLDPMPLEVLATLATDSSQPLHAENIDAELRKRLLEQFLTDHAAWQQARSELDAARSQLAEFKQAAGNLNVMVLSERSEPRATHVLDRGVWNKHGEEVRRAMPEAILARSGDQSLSRLDLAEWLVDRDNPLTARVVVNHLWQLCFGAGLVRTPDDFGLQGQLPTHPELLDWLAVELMEHDWDLQHVLRLIVTSRTYQQSSHVSAELQSRDPENLLLARGARFRLPSWMIRDAALQASGVMTNDLGGPPVRPYQPAGVWEEMFMGRYRYEPSQGTAQYRRTLYAFWRRSAAPTFLFDSAQRRVCEVQIRRTNTPLQALTLLNDESILVASRRLARTALEQHSDPEAALADVFERITSRAPTSDERKVLWRELHRAVAYYQQSPDAAGQFLSFGQPEERLTGPVVTTAACTLVASMVFNLDEAITHE